MSFHPLKVQTVDPWNTEEFRIFRSNMNLGVGKLCQKEMGGDVNAKKKLVRTEK